MFFLFRIYGLVRCSWFSLQVLNRKSKDDANICLMSFVKQFEKTDSIYEEPETDHIYEVCFCFKVLYIKEKMSFYPPLIIY